MTQWFYGKGGEQRGPVSVEDLRAMANSGELTAADLVWNKSMKDWTPAGEVVELSNIFPQTTHPLAYAHAFTGNRIAATPRAIHSLKQTKPWVRLISILMLIGAGFMAVAGIFMVSALGSSRSPARIVPFIAFLGYLVAAVLYTIPALLLNRYASRIQDVLSFGREDNLEAALEAQKSFWKFVGITVAVVLGIYILVVIIAMLGVLV